MTLSDSIQSTTCTFGQWFCDAACFVTQLFILMFVEIFPAIRLLWQENYYGALLLLLCVEGASNGVHKCASAGNEAQCPFKMCNYQEAGDYLSATVHFSPSVVELLVDD